jgi:hypothetical protein
MEGEFRAGKEDDVQGKQRNAFRPHGSQSIMIPEEGTGGLFLRLVTGPHEEWLV